MGMKLKKTPSDIRTLAAVVEFQEYCEEHPGSPAAIRRPTLTVRGPSYVALLGSSLETGIAGIGSTVRAALRASDAQYLNSLRPTP